MDEAKMRKIIEEYQVYFAKNRIKQYQSALESLAPVNFEQQLAHCYSMLDQADEYLNHGKIEKAFCYLSFIEGVLWSVRRFSVSELMNIDPSDI